MEPCSSFSTVLAWKCTTAERKELRAAAHFDSFIGDEPWCTGTQCCVLRYWRICTTLPTWQTVSITTLLLKAIFCVIQGYNFIHFSFGTEVKCFYFSKSINFLTVIENMTVYTFIRQAICVITIISKSEYLDAYLEECMSWFIMQSSFFFLCL